MNRRELIVGMGALGTMAVVPSAYSAAGFVDYSPGLIESELANGKTVFVDYAATWCGTCRRQERVISELMNENPQYAQSMMFIRVDWDTYSSAPVVQDRNIPRRSTLILLKGDAELGRIVAGTAKSQIKQLMDKGLA